ncbi:small integral membrane protein 4 [Bradysia coprophila]|uniref:small integral membrane protein 4 n=1 Tax=Bradysia coprophila TaxID=38358 RepID=UPI00187D72F2|nr:small integral membrane protein 4 [Bradysia coprophila]XP_037041304.1 small integral membrane protein 4 [Bradysia coprophila]
MLFYSRKLTKLLKSIPGEKTFGIYRFLPCFFLLGAALEFSMINWTVGETNFYRTYKRRQAKEIVEHKLTGAVPSDSSQ